MRRPSIALVLLSILVLLVLVLCTFRPVFPNEFVNWDDQSEIVENPDLNPVTLKGLEWNWEHTRLSLYMPVTYMVWGATAAIAGRDRAGVLQPFVFHALNVSLHFVCCVLVFSLLLQLWKRVWPALAGAMVFAVHPLQAEAVAWASGMYTVLSAGLCLGAILIYVRALDALRTPNLKSPTPNVEVTKRRGQFLRSWTSDVGGSTFAFSSLLFVTALLTKAASAALPFETGIVGYFLLGRSIRQVVRSLAVWVLLAIPIVLLAKHFQDVSQIAAGPFWARPMIALDALGFYMCKIVLPISLIPDYGRNPAWVMQHPLPALSSAATAIIALTIAIAARRNARWITAGIGLILAGVLPYLGLTTFDFQYVSTVADRYMYFGMLGVAVLVTGAVIRSNLAGAAVVAAVVVCAVLTHRQSSRWRDTATLFNYTLSVNPRSLISHNVFGYMDARQGKTAEARSHYMEALKIWPQDATILFNLANLDMARRPEVALERYAQAVEYQPGFVVYRNSYAAALARTGHLREAFDQWAKAIAIDPDYVDARNNLGDLESNAGKTDLAKSEYQQVLKIDPGNRHAAQRLMRLEISGGR